MALSEQEKKVLGYMVDNGVVRGAVREQVGQDDTYAREKIAEYKALRIPSIDVYIETAQQQKLAQDEYIATLTAEKQLLEEVQNDVD